MSDLSIRAARPDELEAVGALTLRAYEAAGYFTTGAPSFYAAELTNAEARAAGAELLVATDADGRLLGTVTIARPDTPYAEVSQAGELEFRMLAVDPDANRRGVGEALVRAVIDRARELACAAVVLSCRDSLPAVQRLYERLGFHRLPDRDWSPVPTVHLVAYSLPL